MSRVTPWILSALALIGSSKVVPATPQVDLGERADQRPSLVADARGTLELRGRPGARVLLLAGPLDPTGARGGLRVDPRGSLVLGLDARGSARLQVEPPVGRIHIQAWQAGSGPWGAFSAPVTLGGVWASQAVAGDLVVTEFMKDPSAVSDSHGEWIELKSNKAWRLDIEGVTLSDFSGASFTLDNGGQGILLAPDQRFVLGNDVDPSTNGGVPVDLEWSGFSLKNSSDEILVTGANGLLLDVVLYDDGDRWPDTPGMSISLADPVSDSFANDDPALWCTGASPIGAGPDSGTPGAVNDPCP